MGVNSLPKTATWQRRSCDLNPGPSAPESSTLTTRLPSHPFYVYRLLNVHVFHHLPCLSMSVQCWRNTVAEWLLMVVLLCQLKLYECQQPWKVENENLKSRCKQLSDELARHRQLLANTQDVSPSPFYCFICVCLPVCVLKCWNTDVETKSQFAWNHNWFAYSCFI